MNIIVLSMATGLPKMASYVRLWKRRREVVEDLFATMRLASDDIAREYWACVKIQSWFRGERVRAYLRHLSHSATVIQKAYRGHLGRRKYRILLKERLCEMHQSFYFNMATRIQKMWRGYFVRKYIFDYYAQKEYLRGLAIKNEATCQELARYAEKKREMELSAEEERQREAFREEAERKHYMLSTETARGPYFPSHHKTPHSLEVEMRKVRPDLTARRQAASGRPAAPRLGQRSRTHPNSNYTFTPDAASSIFHEVDAATWYTVSTKDFKGLMMQGMMSAGGGGLGLADSQTTVARHQHDRPRDISQETYDGLMVSGVGNLTRDTLQLPPIKKKVQGPFRTPEEVQRQRYKPLQPTLRVATAYNSVDTARHELRQEEWRGRVVEERFVPFTRKEEGYQPLLHTKSPYKKPAYGTKHFRDEDSAEFLSPQNFRTLVPNIPLFDSMNQTY